ncbi:MAG: hypothetical protein ACRCZD_00740, partial [Phycicoccus sp.]
MPASAPPILAEGTAPGESATLIDSVTDAVHTAQVESVTHTESLMRDGFTVDDLATVLLVGSLVLVVSVVAVRLSLRSGLPSLLLYLGIGVALGESGLGIRYDDEQLTQVLGYAALVVILVEG